MFTQDRLFIPDLYLCLKHLSYVTCIPGISDHLERIKHEIQWFSWDEIVAIKKITTGTRPGSLIVTNRMKRTID